MTKYAYLTKEILQNDYNQLGSLSAIGKKYGIPTGSIKSRAHMLKIKMHASGGRCKYFINENIFQSDSENSFYVAGFCGADGNITYHAYGTKALIIGLARQDQDHLVKIKNAIDFTGPICDYEYFNADHKICYSSYLKIYCSKKIIADIETNFNIVPRKTFTYTFPINIVNHELVRDFIRGYFDGDGCFYFSERDNSVSFELLGTQSFLETVKLILDRDCNFTSTVHVLPIKNIFRLRYAGKKEVFKIVNYLYAGSTIYLDRKFDKIKHLITTG